MLKVGITGGIGSGKSMVCSLFSLLGRPVYNSDDRARKLLNSDPRMLAGLTALFGLEILDDQGKPDRKKIGSLVFADAELLQKLNALIHPAVFRDFDLWVESLDRAIPYCIREAAIMFESGSDKQNNINVLVYAPLEKRILRVCKRDRLARAEVLGRISKQMSEEEKMKLSDHIIYNNDTDSLIEQVMELDKIFNNIK